jgi:sec-independent protein translocase protein TatB
MFQIGWAEMMVIGVVALIVIGPEDLPDMFRQMGRFTAKLRAMGREFQKAMDQAAKDSGVKDVAKDLATITSPKAMGLDAVKAAADKFEKWDPIKNAANPTPKVTKAATAGEAAADSADMALEGRTSAALSSMSSASSLTSVAELKAAAQEAEPSILNPALDPANKAMGPATKALYDKQAARAAVLAESAAKLKAIDEADAFEPVASPAAEEKPKRKPRVAKVEEPAAPAPVAKASKAKKSADTAEAAAPVPRKTKPVKADLS